MEQDNENPCNICRPAFNATDWTFYREAYCLIDNVCVAEGTPNPTQYYKETFHSVVFLIKVGLQSTSKHIWLDRLLCRQSVPAGRSALFRFRCSQPITDLENSKSVL